MPESEWVSAHVFSHGDLDQVLIHLVDPLVRELATDGLTTGWFYLRYWDGGRHIRLRLRAGPERHEPVRRRVEQRCAELFHTRPAPDLADPADYPAWAAELARQERVPDYHRQPYPNNSVAFLPYRREHERYGQGAAMAAVERHFVESSRIALALVTAGLPGGQRDTAALSMLLLSWFGLSPSGEPGGPGRPGPSSGPGPGPGSGSGDEESYLRQQDTLRQVAERMRTMGARPPGSGGGSLAAWAGSVARLRTSLAAAGTGYRDIARIVDLCAHLACNRLGVSTEREAHLRYLAGRTIATLPAAPEPSGSPS